MPSASHARPRDCVSPEDQGTCRIGETDVHEPTEECLDAWDAMAEKADQEFHHEMVKFIRGKDHDIKPGSVWMIKAEIAKRLTANSPDLWLTPNDLTCSKR